MNLKPFLKPRITGKRFEDHAIPLEFLKDFAVLEDLIIETAKWRFLKGHPDRKRAPRGFPDGISLKMTEIEDGSAMPVISLFLAAGMLVSEYQPYFYEALDSIVAAIGAAENNKPVVEHLPDELLTYFDRFGRSLREQEAIEFTSATQQSPVRLTKETRRNLVLSSSNITELSEEVTLYGAIPEADQIRMTFDFQSLDGRLLRDTPILREDFDAMMEAFAGYKRGLRVRLQGIGQFNRTKRLQRIESVEYLTLLDPLDISARLEELRLLKDGWLDGEGTSPEHSGLDWLNDAFQQYYSDDLPSLHMYPTPSGQVRAEWSFTDHEISLDIDLITRVAVWHHLNLDADNDESREINLAEMSDWEWLTHQLRELREGT